MTAVRGFPPLADRRATVLILGSMPGRASLAAGRYYAHPRNAFWPIMGDLLQFDPGADYALRGRALLAAGIAVWDVLASCRRRGSLDADIQPDSIAVNDFASFFHRHPRIDHVFFNGGAAATCFRRHVSPTTAFPGVAFRQLPSTSPAHASRSYAEKLAAWRVVTEFEPRAILESDTVRERARSHCRPSGRNRHEKN